jgi:hypothetical protein
MSDHELIDAVKRKDIDGLKKLITEGGDVNQRDAQGWTPLSWAAGEGDVGAVELLLDSGADITLTGKENWTPLMIARAANRAEVVEVLKAAEKARGVWKDPLEGRTYCKAFVLKDLREWASWAEKSSHAGAASGANGGGSEAAPLSDDDVVYLHHDFTVTASLWPGENIIFDQVTPDWEEFCRTRLNFAVNEDLL